MLNRIIIALGFVWVGIGVWALFEPLSALTSWRKEIVRIVDVEIKPSRPGLLWRRNVIVEAQNGDGARARSINSSETRVGSRVRALVDPANPRRVYLPDETSFWLVPVGFLAGGLFSAMVGWTRQHNGGRPVQVKL
jgi:hypothetical protein